MHLRMLFYKEAYIFLPVNFSGFCSNVDFCVGNIVETATRVFFLQVTGDGMLKLLDGVTLLFINKYYD